MVRIAHFVLVEFGLRPVVANADFACPVIWPCRSRGYLLFRMIVVNTATEVTRWNV